MASGKSHAGSAAGPQEESNLKYFIAAAVIGACVGNMFVARRMRSISKIKVPTGESVLGNSRGSTQKGAEYVEANRNRRAREDAAARERARQSERLRDFNYQREQQEQVKTAYQRWARGSFNSNLRPPKTDCGDLLSTMGPSLRVLGLPPDQLPSRKEIKEAFAKVALESHPDRLESRSDINSTEKASHQRKFAQASDAHQMLIKHVEALES